MKGLEKGFADLLARYVEQDQHGLLITAFSGGLDSSVLLYLANQYSRQNGVPHLAVHIDHGLRENSSADALHCQNVCVSLGIPFAATKLSSKPPGANYEAWARENRYSAIEKLANMASNPIVMTAHHSDDQAETLLFRLLSGRFMSSAFGINERGGQLLRPLLSYSREQLEKYANDQGLEWREDPSNMDQDRERNFIRHSLVPLIEERYGSGVSGRLSACMERIAEDEAYLNSIVKCTDDQPLTIGVLRDLPFPIAWRTLRDFSVNSTEEAKKIGFGTWKELIHKLPNDGQCLRSDIGFGVRIEMSSRGDIRVFDATERVESQQPWSIECKVPFEQVLPTGSKIEASELLPNELATDRLGNLEGVDLENFYVDEERIAYFDLERLNSNNLQIRSFVPGDCCRVWARGSRKLKKLFQEAGFSEPQKRAQPVVLDQNEQIIWLPGLARSEVAPISAQTNKVLMLKLS